MALLVLTLWQIGETRCPQHLLAATQLNDHYNTLAAFPDMWTVVAHGIWMLIFRTYPGGARWM